MPDVSIHTQTSGMLKVSWHLQAGHFGLAPFDPAGIRDSYNQQAEVGLLQSECLPHHDRCSGICLHALIEDDINEGLSCA